jgi:hypothetical protein
MEPVLEDSELQVKRALPVDAVAWTRRMAKCLLAANIKTLGQLADLTDGQLLKMPNLGRLCLSEVKATLLELDIPRAVDARPIPPNVRTQEDVDRLEAKRQVSRQAAQATVREQTLGKLRQEIVALRNVLRKANKREVAAVQMVMNFRETVTRLEEKVAKQNHRIGLLEGQLTATRRHFDDRWSECHDGSESACSKAHED